MATEPLDDLGAALTERLDALHELLTHDTVGAQHEALLTQQALMEQTEAQLLATSTAVQQHADSLIDSLASLQSGAAAAASQATQAVETALQDIDQGLSSANEALSNATEAFEKASGAVTQSVGAFSDHVKVQSTDVLFKGLHVAFVDRVATADHQLLGAAAEHGERLSASVDDLLNQLTEAMSSVTDSLSSSMAEAQENRQAVEPALDAVKVVMDPLMEQVSRVESLAKDLGVL